MGLRLTSSLLRSRALNALFVLLALVAVVIGSGAQPAGAGVPASGEKPDTLTCEGQGRVDRVRRFDIGEGRSAWGPSRRASGRIGYYGYRHTGSFGGNFLDTGDWTGDGPRPTVWAGAVFSSRLALHHRRIAVKLADEPDAVVRFFRGKLSTDQLEELQHKIHSAMGGDDPSYDPPGDYWGNGIDVRRNVIEVDISPFDRSIAREIRDRFGPAVCIPD